LQFPAESSKVPAAIFIGGVVFIVGALASIATIVVNKFF
jgi:hypothetical protein